jgi:Terminase large subunit, T4likevirus-type, N-terminal
MSQIPRHFKLARDLILGNNNPVNSDTLNIFLNKPFWICDKEKHDLEFLIEKGNCCFNHIIGLPVKNGIEHVIYDYELDVVDKIQNHRNVWIKKASGIGATELILRYLTWKILINNDLEYKNIFIISGTYQQHANDVKARMENLFRKRFPSMQLESKFTDLWIKNTNIKIFPSRNVKDLRGYTDVSYLFIDEADHFDPSVNNELLHAITRYEEKSNCTTIMVSTPNRPDGLFQCIEKDPNSKYEKIILHYTVGLGKIYDPLEIEKKKLEPEFPREYECLYLGKVGNVFTPQQLDECIKLAEPLKDITISNYNLHSVGVDFGFSSSRTAIVMTEHLKTDVGEDKIIVRFSEEYDKVNPQTIVDICHKLYRDNWNTIFFVDGANRGAVNLMKVAFDESLIWETNDVSPELMKIIPVNFQTEHKSMLSHLHTVISKQYLAIPSKYDKLITSLRTAYATELNLDKQQTSYDDSLDALRLSLKGYNIE